MICLCLALVLAGCSTYDELLDKEPQKQAIEKEVIKEKIVYRDRNITINNTIPCKLTCLTYNNTPRERELELLRRVKFLEGQTDKYWNDSECHWELNKTKNELNGCEEELCNEWNSSWC